MCTVQSDLLFIFQSSALFSHMYVIPLTSMLPWQQDRSTSAPLHLLAVSSADHGRWRGGQGSIHACQSHWSPAMIRNEEPCKEEGPWAIKSLWKCRYGLKQMSWVFRNGLSLLLSTQETTLAGLKCTGHIKPEDLTQQVLLKSNYWSFAW